MNPFRFDYYVCFSQPAGIPFLNKVFIPFSPFPPRNYPPSTPTTHHPFPFHTHFPPTRLDHPSLSPLHQNGSADRWRWRPNVSRHPHRPHPPRPSSHNSVWHEVPIHLWG